jgi:hypothetical protein
MTKEQVASGCDRCSESQICLLPKTAERRTNCAQPEPRFLDQDNERVVFLSQGIGSKYWGTFYLGPRGSLKRKSPILPMRLTRARAEFELRALAAKRGWVEV